MIFGDRQPPIGHAVGADSRAHDDVPGITERAHVAARLVGVEADHVDSRVKAFPLHRLLEECFIRPVALNEPHAIGKPGTDAAIEAGYVVPQFQQDTHNTQTNQAGAADDTDFHRVTSFIIGCKSISGITGSGSGEPYKRSECQLKR